MAEQDDIRDDLDTEVFQAFGKEVTLNSLSSPTYNIYGDEEVVSSASSTITIVPYNIIDKRQSHQAFGEMEEGEMDAAVRYDIDININDQLTINSETWLVKNIEINDLPDNVVTIVRLTRQQN